MATVYPCKDVTITIATTAIPGIVDASFTLAQETIDATEIADSWKNPVPGQRSATMTGNIYYNQGSAPIAALESALTGGTSVAVVWTSHNQATYTGNGYVTAFTPSVAVNDVVRASFTIQFYGSVTVG